MCLIVCIGLMFYTMNEISFLCNHLECGLFFLEHAWKYKTVHHVKMHTEKAFFASSSTCLIQIGEKTFSMFWIRFLIPFSSRKRHHRNFEVLNVYVFVDKNTVKYCLTTNKPQSTHALNVQADILLINQIIKIIKKTTFH